MIAMRYTFIFIATLWITPYSRCNDEFMSDEDLPDYDQEKHSYFYDKNGFYSFYEPKPSIPKIHSNFTSPSLNPRFERDGNANLDTSVSQMQRIARITNGIYLIRGFIDGSITSDAFISELLHLGTATPTAIKAMGFDDLRTAFGEIASTTLIGTKAATTIENRYLFLAKLRNETADLDEAITLKGATEFKDELAALNKNVESISTEIKDLQSKSNKFIGLAEKLNKMVDEFDPKNTKGKKEALDLMFDMQETLDKLQVSSRVVSNSFKFNHTLNIDQIFKPLYHSLRVALFVIDNSNHLIPNLNTDGIKKTSQNIEKLFKLGALFKDKQTEMANVRSIYLTRLKQPSSSLLYTNGFYEGAADMHEIAKDLNDPWIRSVTSEADSLGRALGKMSSLGTRAASVDASLGSAPEAKVQALDKVNEIGQGLVPYSGDSKHLTDAMNEVDDCDVTKITAFNKMDGAQQVKDVLGVLKKKISDLQKIEKSAHFLEKTDQALREISYSLNKSYHGGFLDEITKINKSPEVKIVYYELKDNRLADEDLKFGETVADFEKLYPDIAEFQKSMSNNQKIFKCLKDVKDFDDIPIAIKAIENVRQIEPKTIQKGVDAIDLVVGATRELVQLETMIQNLKGGRTPETDALNQLSNPATHSITLGLATSAIVKMRHAITNKADFDEVLNHLKVVTEMMHPSLDAGDKKNLNTLVGLEKNFRAMSDSLDVWKRKIEATDSKVLKDHAKIFIDAVSVTGIDQDLRKMSQSVERLEKLVQNKAKEQQLKRLRTALERLDSDGLKLSDHSKYLPEAQQSLDALDLFFVKYTKVLHPPAPPPAPKPTPPPEDTDEPRSKPKVTSEKEYVYVKEEPSTTESPGLAWWGNTLITFAVTVIIMLILQCLCMNWMGRRREKRLEAAGGLKTRVEHWKLFEIETKEENKKKAAQDKLDNEKRERSKKELAKKMKKAKDAAFQKFITEKVDEQKSSQPIPFMSMKPVVDKSSSRKKGGADTMVFEDQGIQSNTLLPQTFFNYFKTLYGSSLINPLLECVVGRERELLLSPELRYEKYKIYKEDMIKLLRHSMSMNWDTMVLTSTCLNPANYVSMPNSQKIIFTQYPLAGTELDEKWAMFYEMVLDTDSQCIVMLCAPADDGYYFPKLQYETLPPPRKFKNGRDGERFPNNRFIPKIRCGGQLETNSGVECRSLEVMPPISLESHDFAQEELKKEELKNKYTKDWTPRTVDQVLYTPEHEVKHYMYNPTSENSSLPQDPATMAKIFKEVYKENNLILHCSNGLGASASFACCMHAYQQLCQKLEETNNEKADVNFTLAMTVVRSHRYDAIEEPMQLGLSAMTLLDAVYAGEMINSENEKKYRELVECYVKAIDLQNEENVKNKQFRESPEIAKKKVADEKKKDTSKTSQATKESKDDKKSKETKNSKDPSAKKSEPKVKKPSVEKKKKEKSVDKSKKSETKEKSIKKSQSGKAKKSTKSDKKPPGDQSVAVQIEKTQSSEDEQESKKRKKWGKSVMKTVE